MEDWRQGGFGLYLHWPFCQSKCPYCDFNSHVATRVDQKRWKTAYLSEIDRVGAETQGRILQTVFFGGGTPSLMEPALVAAILDRVRATWPIANDWEVTLEANPGSVEAGRFRDYRQAGVNRISMGIQSLNDADLVRLGRLHGVAEAKAAFAIARDTFDRVSFDLIYARQHQTLSAWRAELTEALSLAADHLSLYQLTVEDGTAFGDRLARGRLYGLPQEALSADMYLETQEICDKAGLPAYEISNHARPGSESRHNLIYWQAGDYAAVGPGAHGRVTLAGKRWATEAAKAPGNWLQKAETGNAETVRTQISGDEQGMEYLIMGLRISDGISLKRFEALTGHPLPGAHVKSLSDIGMVTMSEGRLKATLEGRLVLNSVIAALAGA